MEDACKCKQRPVRCRFEPHRLEEELLALAYEQILPQLRRVVSGQRSAKPGLPAPTDELAGFARRA